jgi:hypothetical protein
LHYIKDLFGFGRVKPNTATTHWDMVGHTKELYLLILLFNGNIVVPKCHKRFCKFVTVYNQRISNPLAIAQWGMVLPKITVQHQLIWPGLNDAWPFVFRLEK